MPDPTKEELDAVAAKMDAKAFADFRRGLEKAHYEELFNHPNNRRVAFYDIPKNLMHWLMRLRLPVVDMIADPGERNLLYWREMRPEGRVKLLSLITKQNEVVRKVDPVSGEAL
jgi:hypothetical protein